jgi:hypothetical protein
LQSQEDLLGLNALADFGPSRVGGYADLGLGFVDAAVIAACERLGEPKVATLDRRDFSVIVPRHVPALELLP